MSAKTRVTSEVINQSDRFIFKQKDYARQFSHVYLSRLKILGDLLKEKAEAKWGKFFLCSWFFNCNLTQFYFLLSGRKYQIKELRDLREQSQEICVIIGTLFKQQTLKPSILKEISEKNQLVPQPLRTNYVDDSDKLILEDTLQRIKVTGKLDVHNVVTGIVCAILGKKFRFSYLVNKRTPNTEGE